mgnify:CR=1 FL=1
MNKLFILAGSSGAGKSTLLNRVVKEGYCDAANKYSERKRFSSVDDVITVENLDAPNLQCDLIYMMYGNRYGFCSEKIIECLKEKSQILITNDIKTIENLKKLFPKQVVIIYIISDINKRLFREIYMERQGVPSLIGVKDQIVEMLQNGEKMLLQDEGKKFLECVKRINQIIDSILLEEKEFKLRLESIERREELYLIEMFRYDYVVLNLYSNEIPLTHATKFAFMQLKKIIHKETEDWK